MKVTRYGKYNLVYKIRHNEIYDNFIFLEKDALIFFFHCNNNLQLLLKKNEIFHVSNFFSLTSRGFWLPKEIINICSGWTYYYKFSSIDFFLIEKVLDFFSSKEFSESIGDKNFYLMCGLIKFGTFSFFLNLSDIKELCYFKFSLRLLHLTFLVFLHSYIESVLRMFLNFSDKKECLL